MGRSLDHLIGELIDAGSREHYEDAELYDYEYRRRRADIAFYRGLASGLLGGPGRILDLGCGSGRLSLALARDGHEVVGVDQSAAMLERLEARLAKAPPVVQGRVRTVNADLRTFDLGLSAPLAFAAFNVVEHLYTRGEVVAWLGCVARHLEPDGHLAFDVQMPDLAWLLRDSSRRWARTRFTHPRTGQKLFYSTNHDYDPVSQIAVIRIYYEPTDGRGRTQVVKLTQRKFFPAELETLLWAGGFELVQRFGDFQGQPLDGGAESQVLVCRPRAARPVRSSSGGKARKAVSSSVEGPAKRSRSTGAKGSSTGTSTGAAGASRRGPAPPGARASPTRRASSTRKASRPTFAPTSARRRINVRPTK